MAIESPVLGSDEAVETIGLSGEAMATSGNARQWNRRAGGGLVAHILDPATGSPVVRPPCSVTVIGPRAALASGWATALFVLGPEGSRLAEVRGMRVIWHGDPDGSRRIPPRQPANPVQD